MLWIRSDNFGLLRPPDRLGGKRSEVWKIAFEGVETLLDLLHRVDVFDLSLLAGGDDQTLRADRLLGLVLTLTDLEELPLCESGLGLLCLDLDVDVDEGSQALVLAKIAAGRLVTLLTEGDAVDLVHADPLGLVPQILVETPDLEGRPDRPRLAAMAMHDDLGLHALRLEALLNKIDLRLDRGEVVLSAALQDKARTQLGEVRDLRDVEPDVLWQNVGEPRHDLLGRPALTLEVDDIRLHEDRTAVAEGRHRLGREGEAGVLAHVVAKARRRALQEVTVARRALSVELEVLHLAVFQDDDLDVLAADVTDDIDVVIKVQRALAMSDSLDDRRIGPQHIAEDVLRVAGGANAEDLEVAIFGLDLMPQIRE